MLRTVVSSLFGRAPRSSSSRKSLVSRLALESLEMREVPAAFTWAPQGSSQDFYTASNWYVTGSTNRPLVAPRAGDDVTFDGSVTSAPCDDIGVLSPPPPGGLAMVNPNSGGSGGGTSGLNSLTMKNQYMGTVSVVAPLSIGTMTMNGASSSAIAQPSEVGGNDITVTTAFTWNNGTLNNTTNLVGIILQGASTIAPASGGAVSLGDNITVANGAALSVAVGTVNVANANESLTVQSGGAVTINPGLGQTATLDNPLINVQGGGKFTVSSGEFISGGRITNAGTYTQQTNTTAYYSGVAGQPVAFLQSGGGTYLYGSTSTTLGLATNPTKNIQVSGGIFDTIVSDGTMSYPAYVNIKTQDFQITGGDVYINYVAGVPHQVFGELYVIGDVVWTGGNIHMYVEGNVNNGAPLNSNDYFLIGGKLYVGQNANLELVSVVNGVPTAATSGYTWNIFQASNGIALAAGTPTYDTADWLLSVIAIPGGTAANWQLKAQ